MASIKVMFWLATAVIVYTYVGYPLLISAWARWRTRPHRRAESTPRVSILVIAHNEAAQIAGRIENLLELDYEPERLEIVIASDGSSDATAVLANSFRRSTMRVEQFEMQRGKPAVLNDLIPTLAGEIVVLMDVRQCIEKSAIRWLVRNFADADVGAVSGELVLTRQPSCDDAAGVSMEGVGFYWRYEKFIRSSESRVDSTVGATGALYAIRRELFSSIPADTVLDDVLIPMQIARKGYRVLFEANAMASESLSASPAAEYRRKVRTIAGNYQLFVRQPWLLSPLANRLWLQTVSHKLLRLLCPAFLLVALVANLLLAGSYFYRGTLLLQGLFYGAALAAQLVPRWSRKSVLLAVPHAFCLLNWATIAGFGRFLRGRQQVTWSRGREPDPR